jgi:hypothetical protein
MMPPHINSQRYNDMGYILAGAAPKTAAKTVPTGTAERLTATNAQKRAIGNGIEIYSLTTNTVAVYIGGSDVTTSNGRPIMPGGSISLPVDDPSKVWCISGTASQEIRILWI